MLKTAGSKPHKVPPKFPPASDSFSKGADLCAKVCKEMSKESVPLDLSLLSENSWLPKLRDEKGTTKDPEEPAPNIGDKVRFPDAHLCQAKF